jgi:hypothetical protein
MEVTYERAASLQVRESRDTPQRVAAQHIHWRGFFYVMDVTLFVNVIRFIIIMEVCNYLQFTSRQGSRLIVVTPVDRMNAQSVKENWRLRRDKSLYSNGRERISREC